MPCVRQPEHASGGQWRHAILTISERDLHFEAPGARVADLKQAQEVVLFIIDSIFILYECDGPLSYSIPIMYRYPWYRYSLFLGYQYRP